MRLVRWIALVCLPPMMLIPPRAVAAPGLAAGSDRVCGPTWQGVGGPRDRLTWPGTAVAAISATDAWLVGGTVRDNGLDRSLIEHWDGANWVVVVPGKGPGYLRDVAAVSDADAWAVGSTDISGHGDAQVVHWDGVKWRPVPTTPVGDFSELKGIDTTGSRDAWAVGWTASGSQATPLIEHWNGVAWSVVSSPQVAGGYLDSVSAVAADDAWATGFRYTDQYTKTKTLVEHWDGTAWSEVSSPNPGATNNGLTGVEAISADDIWAVGSSFDPSTGLVPMVQHWDGTQWSVVVLPPVDGEFLQDVAAVSANDVWAVGGFPGTLVMHWDGTAWTKADAPSPSDDDWISSVSALPTGEVWASGIDDSNSSYFHPLRLHLCES